MNTITIAGRVGKEPEMRSLPDGTAVLSFSVADDQGRDKKPIWWNASIFGNRATALQQYIRKGEHITIVGRVSEREWTGQDGQPRKSLDVRVQEVALQGGKPQQSHQQPEAGASNPYAAAKAGSRPAPQHSSGDFEGDSIPF